jgi:hypothetical protein
MKVSLLQCTAIIMICFFFYYIKITSPLMELWQCF